MVEIFYQVISENILTMFMNTVIKDRGIVFNGTFNNISVISYWSVLLLEETGVPGEDHIPVASHRQTLSHTIVSSTPPLRRVQTHNVSGDMHLFHR
jgi:hypothetical protein